MKVLFLAVCDRSKFIQFETVYGILVVFKVVPRLLIACPMLRKYSPLSLKVVAKRTKVA